MIPEIIPSRLVYTGSPAGIGFITINNQVIQDACFIVQLLKDHIAKENEILYPIARDYLSPFERIEVAKKMGLG